MKYDSRALKYAILGLLLRKPMTGYDISKEFEKSISEFWSAKHSQIYPELKKLVSENLITCETECNGEPRRKKLYTISHAGRQDFGVWLRKNEDIDSPPKDIFRLRTYFFDLLDKECQYELLSTQLLQHRRRLLRLEEKYKKYDTAPSDTDAAFGDYLVLYGAILREKAQIHWLQTCLDHLCL